MWEVKAAPGRVDELLAVVLERADPAAQVYRSRDGRVVVIDPTGHGIGGVDAELIDRPPHSWTFQEVTRG